MTSFLIASALYGFGYASIYWCSAIIMGLFLLSYAWFVIQEKYVSADDLEDAEAAE